MALRDFLNEFELDWAQAPVRSELIPGKKLKDKKILLVGNHADLIKGIAWSFMAWNDRTGAGIQAAEGALRGAKPGRENGQPRFAVSRSFTEDTFIPTAADYVILTGLCCQEIPSSAAEMLDYLQEFRRIVETACRMDCRRILLLSDGRVYGRLGHAFAASEYEMGQTNPADPDFSAQYLLQAMESILISSARTAGKEFEILRTAQIYGAGISMMENPVQKLAHQVADAEEMAIQLSPERSSYLCIHDLLTAIQFVLLRCPENKIFNAKGLDSDKSKAELAVTLYQNFPEKCRLNLTSRQNTQNKSTQLIQGAEQQTVTGQNPGADCTEAAADRQIRDLASYRGMTNQRDKDARCKAAAGYSSILLNTQLLEHYGFSPKINMEDGLIILVKSLQNTGEVFIFDNTYLGKLEKVQKILLGYLLEIDRICKKHDIKYFLAGGTLLGAIRHHGFIPWDDDADVMMLREDYDKFQQVVQQELPDNIFMQLPTTEKGNHNPFTKLRINNTMFATEFTGHFMDMHNGIFFDVLSHDKTGNHRWSQKLHLMLTMLTRSIVFNKWGDTDIKSGGNHPIICKIVDKAKYLVPMRFAEWAQNKSLTFFKNRKSDYLYDGMGRNLKRGPFPKEWLDEAVYVDFEDYQFPVPKEYDKYLTYLYGDYMQMIPVSERRTSHSIVLTDLGEYADFRLGEAGKKDAAR